MNQSVSLLRMDMGAKNGSVDNLKLIRSLAWRFLIRLKKIRKVNYAYAGNEHTQKFLAGTCDHI